MQADRKSGQRNSQKARGEGKRGDLLMNLGKDERNSIIIRGVGEGN